MPQLSHQPDFCCQEGQSLPKCRRAFALAVCAGAELCAARSWREAFRQTRAEGRAGAQAGCSGHECAR